MAARISRRCLQGALGQAQTARGSRVRGFCASVGSIGSIKVNNIPEWAPPYKENAAENRFKLPYRDCTILTVLDSVGMAGRADCRQGVCKKCAMNVSVAGSSEVHEVLTCQEIAIDGLTIDLPDGWQPKPKWADPHPEKVRVTTRELKATSKLRYSALLGRKLKNFLRVGNFAFKQRRWDDAMNAMDDIDLVIEKYGFSSYVEFSNTSTLARDALPDFLVALGMSPQVAGFTHVPPEVADKANELAADMKEHLETHGTSAAAFSSDMDEMTIGSHGAGKKGAQTDGLDGGTGGMLSSGAFFRNFSVYPEMVADQEQVEE